MAAVDGAVGYEPGDETDGTDDRRRARYCGQFYRSRDITAPRRTGAAKGTAAPRGDNDGLCCAELFSGRDNYAIMTTSCRRRVIESGEQPMQLLLLLRRCSASYNVNRIRMSAAVE